MGGLVIKRIIGYSASEIAVSIYFGNGTVFVVLKPNEIKLLRFLLRGHGSLIRRSFTLTACAPNVVAQSARPNAR